MLRRSSLLALVAAVLAAAGPGLAATAPLTREEAIARALSKSPELAALEAELEAARGRLGADRRALRANPVVEGAVGPRDRGADDTLDWSVGLRQPIELAGQRGDRIERRESELAAIRARREATRAAVAYEARRAFGAALAAEERQRLAAESVRLARAALDAASERLRTGAGTRLELNTARIELGRAMREESVAGIRLASARAALALLVAAPPEAALAPSGELGGQLAAPAAELRGSQTERMDVIAARRGLEAARSARELAAAEGFPDVTVGASYAEEEGDRIVQGTLAIPLPVFDRNQEGRAAAGAEVRRAEAELAALERRAAAELRLALARHESARATVDAFGREALQAIRQNLELIDEAYRAGKIDFLQLLVVRRETLASQLAWVDAREELDRAEAEVLRALGRID